MGKTEALIADLTQSHDVTENEACMQPSLYIRMSKQEVGNVTNSVTNRVGNRRQSRATVTNSVTKLRAIQGNEITTIGESRAMEGT